MTLVAAADYLIVPKDMEETALREHNSVTPVFPDNWNEALAAFLEQPEIKVMKKTKRSEKEVDIRPMIYDMHMEPSGICMQLAAGSENNLKPDLVMETFLKYVGEEEVKLPYHRREVYAKNPESENPRFVSLESLGWDILSC